MDRRRLRQNNHYLLVVEVVEKLFGAVEDKVHLFPAFRAFAVLVKVSLDDDVVASIRQEVRSVRLLQRRVDIAVARRYRCTGHFGQRMVNGFPLLIRYESISKERERGDGVGNGKRDVEIYQGIEL